MLLLLFQRTPRSGSQYTRYIQRLLPFGLVVEGCQKKMVPEEERKKTKREIMLHISYFFMQLESVQIEVQKVINLETDIDDIQELPDTHNQELKIHKLTEIQEQEQDFEKLESLHRAASPLVRLMEGEARWEAPDHPQGVFPQNWDGNEPNQTVTSMMLKAKANDRRKNLALNFVGLDLTPSDR
ncbi:hypothetical protein TNCV_3579061 [Trichonephila clavipes]|nr:hypothetical protein TNCV_3579061 [Trichonephila clavipes]